LLVNSADLQRQTPTTTTAGQLPYDFLDQFHVFVLANILLRPIIVVGEPYLRSVTGDYIEPNDFVGVYLPLLWHPLQCLRAPIVLVFLMDHFLPLASRSRGSGDALSDVWAVPLVTAAMEPLRVHFLLPREETGAYVRLQLYLELIELQAAGDGGCDAVLAAKIILDSCVPADGPARSRRGSVTVRDLVYQGGAYRLKCSEVNCEFLGIFRLRGAGRLCFACSMSHPPYQSLVDDELRGVLEDGLRMPQCANVDCVNTSWLPSGGLCRLCSLGCYPRHYDMPVSSFISSFAQLHTARGGMYDNRRLSVSLDFFLRVGGLDQSPSTELWAHWTGLVYSTVEPIGTVVQLQLEVRA